MLLDIPTVGALFNAFLHFHYEQIYSEKKVRNTKLCTRGSRLKLKLCPQTLIRRIKMYINHNGMINVKCDETKITSEVLNSI